MPRKSIFALTVTESPRGNETKTKVIQDNRKVLINYLTCGIWTGTAE